jgi:hypothetical protein
MRALADRSHRPATCPHQMSPVTQAKVLALRHHNSEWDRCASNTSWAARVWSRCPGAPASTGCCSGGGLVSGERRRRRRVDYRQRERSRPMDLWQMDVVSMPPSD